MIKLGFSIKDILVWFSNLSKATMTVTFASALIISTMLVYIYLRDFAQKGTDSLDSIHRQLSAMDSINRVNWDKQFSFNRQVDSVQHIHRADIYDLTMITAANSNSALLRQLLPHLNGIKEDTYRLVLNIQKREVLRPDSLTFGIGVRKVKQ